MKGIAIDQKIYITDSEGVETECLKIGEMYLGEVVTKDLHLINQSNQALIALFEILDEGKENALKIDPKRFNIVSSLSPEKLASRNF